MERAKTNNENAKCIVDIWNGLSKAPLKGSGQKGNGQEAFWNRRAANYSKNVPSDRSNKNVAAVIDFLGAAGFDPAGKEVLDIGSGPGTLALPLARMGAKVTALDISANMLEKLKEKARKEKISGIETVHASWHDVDLDAVGFRKRFDLAIASMTPGVSDKGTFDKMMGASKHMCYYSGFLKRAWDPAYYDLHRALFNEEFADHATGFHIPFMYLYTLGYEPSIKLYRDKWSTDDPVEEMAGIVYDFLTQNKEPGDNAMDVIRAYLAQRARKGVYHAETNVFTGMMTWAVANKR